MSRETHEQAPGQSLGYVAGVRTIFGLEMRQRLRGRAWYIMLAVWFVVIGLVFTLAALTMEATGDRGPILFELVVGFVLLFGLLVAPGLSANAVNGDRAAGTLAILQVTLVKPGQLLWGKWLASWVASFGFLVLSAPFIFLALAFGGVNPVEALVSLMMLGVELGLVCALGVGISALAARPLFSIVTTYMLVALLSLGTLIAFSLSLFLVEEENVEVTYSYPAGSGFAEPGAELDEDGCITTTMVQSVYHTERTAWMLASNPFVIVADAVPYGRTEEAAPHDPEHLSAHPQPGIMELISQGVRAAQAGADYEMTCEESQGHGRTNLEGQFPIWPLGLGLQSALAGAVLWAGRRKLVTPVRRLARGTRIA